MSRTAAALSRLGLHQQVQNLALAIDRSPQPQPLAADGHEHLVEVPLRTRARTSGPQPARELRAELPHPSPDRLIGDVEPALGQKLLHISETQREAEVEPNGLSDHLGRETVARVGDGLHG